MGIEFKKIELKHRETIEYYLQKKPLRGCDLTFANVYLWKRQYPTTFAVIEDALVFHPEQSLKPEYSFPIGEKEAVRHAVERLREEAREKGKALHMFLAQEQDFVWMEEWFPGEYTVTYNEDYSDYVYETDKLIALSGKKYHGKKNHVNRFWKTYPDWSYETIGEENIEECFQMALAWRKENECDDHEEKRVEMCATMNALRLMKELHLHGGLIRAEGRVVAFCLGEPMGQDMYVVHFEKAFADVPGAYAVINQQFALHEAAGYRYLNREDAAGSEGLKRAKESYHPVFLIKKGVIRAKS